MELGQKLEVERKVMVIGAQNVDFVGKDGKTVAGCRVHYFDLEEKRKENFVGMIPEKAWIDQSYYPLFEKKETFPTEMIMVLEVDILERKFKPLGFRDVD